MDEPIIKRFQSFKCQHNKFIIDDKLAFVECGLCGEKLNPVWALGQMAYRESRARREIQELEKVVETTKEKLKCKCQHCGKMTAIDRGARYICREIR